jgi:hypothetical protein
MGVYCHANDLDLFRQCSNVVNSTGLSFRVIMLVNMQDLRVWRVLSPENKLTKGMSQPRLGCWKKRPLVVIDRHEGIFRDSILKSGRSEAPPLGSLFGQPCCLLYSPIPLTWYSLCSQSDLATFRLD